MSLIVHSTYLLLAMTTLPSSMLIPSISSNDFLLNRIRAMSTLSCLDGCCWPRRRWICFVFRQISELFFTAASTGSPILWTEWNQGHFLGESKSYTQGQIQMKTNPSTHLMLDSPRNCWLGTLDNGSSNLIRDSHFVQLSSSFYFPIGIDSLLWQNWMDIIWWSWSFSDGPSWRVTPP